MSDDELKKELKIHCSFPDETRIFKDTYKGNYSKIYNGVRYIHVKEILSKAGIPLKIQVKGREIYTHHQGQTKNPKQQQEIIWKERQQAWLSREANRKDCEEQSKKTKNIEREKEKDAAIKTHNETKTINEQETQVQNKTYAECTKQNIDIPAESEMEWDGWPIVNRPSDTTFREPRGKVVEFHAARLREYKKIQNRENEECKQQIIVSDRHESLQPNNVERTEENEEDGDDEGEEGEESDDDDDDEDEEVDDDADAEEDASDDDSVDDNDTDDGVNGAISDNHEDKDDNDTVGQCESRDNNQIIDTQKKIASQNMFTQYDGDQQHDMNPPLADPADLKEIETYYNQIEKWQTRENSDCKQKRSSLSSSISENIDLDETQADSVEHGIVDQDPITNMPTAQGSTICTTGYLPPEKERETESKLTSISTSHDEEQNTPRKRRGSLENKSGQISTISETLRHRRQRSLGERIQILGDSSKTENKMAELIGFRERVTFWRKAESGKDEGHKRCSISSPDRNMLGKRKSVSSFRTTEAKKVDQRKSPQQQDKEDHLNNT